MMMKTLTIVILISVLVIAASAAQNDKKKKKKGNVCVQGRVFQVLESCCKPQLTIFQKSMIEKCNGNKKVSTTVSKWFSYYCLNEVISRSRSNSSTYTSNYASNALYKPSVLMKCVLKQNSLLTADENEGIDYAAFTKYLETNGPAEWKNTIQSLVDICTTFAEESDKKMITNTRKRSESISSKYVTFYQCLKRNTAELCPTGVSTAENCVNKLKLIKKCDPKTSSITGNRNSIN